MKLTTTKRKIMVLIAATKLELTSSKELKVLERQARPRNKRPNVVMTVPAVVVRMDCFFPHNYEMLQVE